MDKSEQISIIEKAAKGDSEAFSILYQTYHDKIDHLCYKFLQDKDESEHIVQYTFTTAFQNLNTLNNALVFEDWLKEIATDKCKDYLKSTNPTLFQDNDSEIRKIDSEETNKIINEIIDQLPDEQRITVVLYYYENKSISEIAAFMECGEGTINKRLNYAHKRICEEIELTEKRNQIKLHSATISIFVAAPSSETVYNKKSQTFENTTNHIAETENMFSAIQSTPVRASFFKRFFKTAASRIIATVLSIAILTTGSVLIINNQKDLQDILFSIKDNDSQDKPFSINDIEINEEIIPYESFENEEFYEKYLKPIMLKAGFKDDGAFVCETTRESHYIYYKDYSAVETKYNTNGRFEIPNSRYVLGFQYIITNHSAAKDFPYNEIRTSQLDYYPESYYALFFDIRAKTDNDTGDGAYGGAYGAFKVFSDFEMITGIWGNGKNGTYTGDDPTATIFLKGHTTIEIYEKLKEYFDNPNIKEKLLIEKQANAQ